MNFGATPIADLLDIGGFSLDSILEIEPGFLSEDHHEHDDEVLERRCRIRRAGRNRWCSRAYI